MLTRLLTFLLIVGLAFTGRSQDSDSSVNNEQSIEEAKAVIKRHKLNIKLVVIKPFYEDPAFIDALVASTAPWINPENGFDHVLFSYHGLPELHLKSADPTGSHCLQREDCCQDSRPPVTSHLISNLNCLMIFGITGAKSNTSITEAAEANPKSPVINAVL